MTELIQGGTNEVPPEPNRFFTDSSKEGSIIYV